MANAPGAFHRNGSEQTLMALAALADLTAEAEQAAKLVGPLARPRVQQTPPPQKGAGGGGSSGK
eukprot:1174388-Prymnesium_polylepis.1